MRIGGHVSGAGPAGPAATSAWIFSFPCRPRSRPTRPDRILLIAGPGLGGGVPGRVALMIPQALAHDQVPSGTPAERVAGPGPEKYNVNVQSLWIQQQ
jgi:hypothetical protein